jgi:hypothetical protein
MLVGRVRESALFTESHGVTTGLKIQRLQRQVLISL